MRWREGLVPGTRGPDFQIAVRVCGPEDGDPWLLLHGFLDNANSWAAFAAEFDPAARLVCIDFAGHGRSSHVHDGVYHVVGTCPYVRAPRACALDNNNSSSARFSLLQADYVADVLAVADHFRLERFSLMGHSMGGGVATCLAGAFPQRVKRLVVIEALGPWVRHPSQAPTNLAASLTRRPSGQQKVFRTIEEAARRRSEGNVGGFLPVHAAAVLCERGLRPSEGGFVWSSDSRVQTPSRMPFHEEHVLAFLAAIKAPTLLILPNDGLVLGPKERLLSRACPALRHVSPFGLPGAALVRVLYACLWVRGFVKGDKRALAHMADLRHLLAFRQRVGRVERMALARLERGGHHPQLTLPKEVADTVRGWVAKL